MPSVLIVEDDEDTRSNLCDLLSLDGFQLRAAGTAAEARSLLEEQTCDLVILDRNLPDGVAEDLLPQLSLIAPHTDFIVVTGFADMDSAIDAMRSGAVDYLLKPIQPAAFRARLKRILELRHTTQQLHKEHEFAEKILGTAEAIVLLLDRQGKIEKFNPYLSKITGWQLEEVQGQDWVDNFIPPEDRERIREVFFTTADGADTRGVINPILARDGSIREVRWSNSSIHDAEGRTTGVLAIGLDVTDLAESQRRALQAERLATIGQMMAALAHESRNALQRIQASADLLDLEIGGNHQAELDLSKIRRAANDLNVLLEEVRSFAAPIHLRWETTSIGSLIQQAWAHLEPLRNGRDAVLNADPEIGDVEIELDMLRCEQVFRNLFENSIAACEQSAQIDIRLLPGNEGMIHLRVQDNGPGLKPDQISQVFDAFYTTKDTGTGLGMAIVQRIVEAHGGTITIDAEYDQGARFNICLPRHRRKRSSAEREFR